MHHLAKVAWGLHLTGGSNPPLSVAILAARPARPGARRAVSQGASSQRVGRALLALLFLPLPLLALGACAAPRWQAAAEPIEAGLIVDGALRRASRIDEPIPYYGVVELSAVPPIGATSSDGLNPLAATRGRLTLEAPVSPWLFPLDFFVEMARTPFVTETPPRIELVCPPRTDVAAPASPPPGLESFLLRARAAAARR
jgi:hypothetical protein